MEDSCIKSDQETSSSGELTRHQRSQEEEELFRQSGELETDNISHSVENNHCDKALKKSSLKRHKLLHTAEILSASPKCKRAFPTSSGNKRHTIYHSKLFQASLFGDNFSSAFNILSLSKGQWAVRPFKSTLDNNVDHTHDVLT